MYQKTSYTRAVLTLCLLVGLLPFLLTALSFARETIRTVSGKVTKVSDGDTIQITTPELTKLRARLYGIDASETVEGEGWQWLRNSIPKNWSPFLGSFYHSENWQMTASHSVKKCC